MNAAEIAAVALLCFGAVGLYCWIIWACLRLRAILQAKEPTDD